MEKIEKNLKDNNSDELMDIYDKNRIKTGKVVKRNNKKSLNDGEYTISVHCFIITSKKQILLTRRNMSKNRGGRYSWRIKSWRNKYRWNYKRIKRRNWY